MQNQTKSNHFSSTIINNHNTTTQRIAITRCDYNTINVIQIVFTRSIETSKPFTKHNFQTTNTKSIKSKDNIMTKTTKAFFEMKNTIESLIPEIQGCAVQNKTKSLCF